MPSAIRVRRVYETPSPDDGARVLVDRVWPRGLRKDAAHLDELSGAAQRKELGRLRALAAAGPVTLLTATKAVEISQAEVLAQVLRQDVESDAGGEAACWAHR